MKAYSQTPSAVGMRRWMAKPGNKAKAYANNLRWKEANKEKIAFYRLRSHLRRTFGIEPAVYYAILDKQKNTCAICKSKPKERLHVDHDHVSGKIRGLLCGNCNRAIGLLKDSPAIIRSAAGYLEMLEV
jgi:hypothetical protein